MLLTEEEAKTKRCPEAFGPGTDEWVTFPDHRKCLGSACMAWRWDKYRDEFGDEHTTLTLDKKPVGYCGKAGKP